MNRRNATWWLDTAFEVVAYSLALISAFVAMREDSAYQMATACFLLLLVVTARVPRR